MLDKTVLHYPDRRATVWGERRRTWTEIGDRVARTAGGLRGLGVEDGERVAVLAMNSDAYLELFFAAAWAGGVIVPLNTRWSSRELADALTDCTPAVLVVDETFRPRLEEILAATGARPRIVTLEAAIPVIGAVRHEDLVTGSAPCRRSQRTGDDLYAIFYTGGTTGRSRGVMLSHRNFVVCSMIWVATLIFSEETVYLHSVGFFHLAGAAPVLALTLAGGTHVLAPKFEAKPILATIERERVNYALFVPTMIGMMLNADTFDATDLSALRDIEYGASPMPVALLEEAMRRIPGVSFRQGYGCTEATALVTCLQARFHTLAPAHKEALTSAGRAVMGVEVRIVDQDGVDVPSGAVGEIAVRGDTVMLGYWNQPEETDRVLRNGWLYTGDGAWMSASGFVHIVDRMKDMIVSGGENVYSSEVEQAVYRHPAVLECAVIGVPSRQWGEQVHAEVVLRPGASATAEEIIAYARGLIAGYKCPKSVTIRHEPLPLTAAGKIQKNLLREPYWAGADRQVG